MNLKSADCLLLDSVVQVVYSTPIDNAGDRNMSQFTAPRNHPTNCACDFCGVASEGQILEEAQEYARNYKCDLATAIRDVRDEYAQAATEENDCDGPAR